MIGKTISHYKILEKIGEGGMGVVYQAQDIRLDRTVALKFLPQQFTDNEEAKKRFIHEAKAASALDHPNICNIFEIDRTPDGQMFIAMAYYEGENLRDRLKRGPLEVQEALNVISQIATGLAKAHEKDIVHRDIKPANILITAEGVVKIVDFGLAKLEGRTRVTKTQTTLGTVAYMSPEQARGDEVDHRTDVWSLGVILYEMITGQLPFKGDYEQAVIYSILNKKPKPPNELREGLPKELEQIVIRALGKNKEDRHQSASDVLKELMYFRNKLTSPDEKIVMRKTFIQTIKQPKIAVPCILVILFLGFLAIRLYYKSSKIRWAREQAIPRIDRLANEGIYNDAFRLAKEAEKYIPSDPMLLKLWDYFSWYVNIDSEPRGATVWWRRYNAMEVDWESIGQTPIDSIRVPIGVSLLKFDKAGFRSGYVTHYWFGGDVFVRLDKEGVIPDDMVRVTMQSRESTLNDYPGYTHLEGVYSGDYLIDIYEVSNGKYKQFVDSGGYEKKEYWKHPFVKDGRTLSWEEAMTEFKDKTGRTGPASWEAGDYPESQGNYPVTGISWYEAAAFAEFAGKSLPTIYHWNWATNTDWACAYIISLSNFSEKGPEPVGGNKGLSGFGVYDMAGNVREWCWNERGGQRYILGGGWNDQPYMFTSAYTQPPFDRSPTNGFRCIKHFGTDDDLAALQSPVEATIRDYRKEKPVSDEIFDIYRSMYMYDETDLNAVIESIDTSATDWNVENISFDAAYDNERVVAYLFLPKNVDPPYQTIVYFPGGGALDSHSFQSIFYNNINFIIKSGRALMFPIYKGTYERGGGLPKRKGKSNYKERVVKYAKDLGRSIDYLETRSDIDTSKLAYYGLSWGGRLGVIMCVVETRFKTTILNVAGLSTSEKLPEVDEINFAPRITIPLLMLNGRYDHFFPYETNQLPMFQLVGTPQEHKRQVVFETGHIVPRVQLIKEVLEWLDRYLGTVK
jgi:serine/threonine protein kinase/cephalosporin-C deacetylase-like acetyl esterase